MKVSPAPSQRVIAAAALLLAGTLAAPFLRAQDAATPRGKSFQEAVESLQTQAEDSTRRLSEVVRKIESEKLPLVEALNRLEEDLNSLRKENEEINKQRDNRTLGLTNLRAQMKSKETQNDFLSNLLDEYIRNFETVLHISEVQRYGGTLAEGKNRALNANVTLEEQMDARLRLVELSLDRLGDAVGGAIFPGTAIDDSGVVGEGDFILVGPLTFFAGEDEKHTGLAETRLGSNEPVVINLPPEQDAMISAVARDREGRLPLDATMGDAIKLAETESSIRDEIEKGGAVMFPLLALAGCSLLIGLCKWIQLSLVQRIGPRRFGLILQDLRHGNRDEAWARANKIRGPIGGMLKNAIEHYDDPRELLEELLFEQVLQARGKLNSFLPFIKITAAASPLLGLLGTVSGMINTFKLIMVFGTGDASTFSSGISEALITTKWGLIVAIPALLLAAYLSRKARAVVDDMEKVGVSFLNALSAEENGNGATGGLAERKSPERKPGAAAVRREEEEVAPAPREHGEKSEKEK